MIVGIFKFGYFKKSKRCYIITGINIVETLLVSISDPGGELTRYIYVMWPPFFQAKHKTKNVISPMHS